MIGSDKGSQLCIIHLDTHQGGSTTLDEGKKRYIHPQYLLRSGHTKNKHAGKEHILPSLFQAAIVTNPLKNVVHYQLIKILKHVGSCVSKTQSLQYVGSDLARRTAKPLSHPQVGVYCTMKNYRQWIFCQPFYISCGCMSKV